MTIIEQSAMQAVISIPPILREANEIEKTRRDANGGTRDQRERRLAESIFSYSVRHADDDETMKAKAERSIRAAKIFFDAWPEKDSATTGNR